MGCCDQDIICKDYIINSGDTTLDTGLVATITGAYVFLMSFNGVLEKKVIAFTANDRMIIPNMFNGDYKHEVQILDPNGALFGGACYSFNIKTSIGVPDPVPYQPTGGTISITYIVKNNPDPTAGDGTPQHPYQLQAGNTITIPSLVGKHIIWPVYLNNGVLQQPTYNSNTATFDNTAYGGFSDGDILTIQYGI